MRWRASPSGLDGGQGAARGFGGVGGVGQQCDGGKAMMAGWRADGRRGSSSAASRRVAERSSLAACSLTGQRCRLDGRGGEGQRLAGRAHSSGGGGQQRAAGGRAASGGSGAASPVLECLRAQGRGGSAREREKGERKGVERENQSQPFDLAQTQDFQMKLEKF